MFRNLTPSNNLAGSPDAWFGRTPAHWTVLPARALFDEFKLTGHETEPLLSVTIRRGVILQSDLLSDSSKKDGSNLDKSKYKLVEPGDIAYNKMRAWQGAVGRSQHRGIVSPAYVVMRPRQDSGAFLEQLMRLPAFAKEAERLSYGITSDMWSLRPEHFKTIYFPVAPADEQAVIVKYLGHAHARIDRAIAAKRKLIALLEEQKQAIIHRAVTRGTDSSVPLKASGVPWIGEIPAHWEVCRAKYLFKEFDIRSHTGSERLLSLRAIAGLVFHDEVSDRLIGPEVLAKYKKVRPGHLVMNRMRAASGLFAIAGTEGLVSPDYSTMEVSKAVDARFYLRLFKTRAAMTEFRQQSSGLGTGESGFMRLYSESFGRIPLPMPPLAEQAAISEELAALEQDGTEITARVSKEIDLLREFRTRLTSDVVTGQVDVREIAVTLPELTEDAPLTADDDSGSDDDLIESEVEFAGANE